MNNKTYLALSLLVSLPLVASEQEQSSSQEKQEIDLKEQSAVQGEKSLDELAKQVLTALKDLNKIKRKLITTEKQYDAAGSHFENIHATYLTTILKKTAEAKQLETKINKLQKQLADPSLASEHNTLLGQLIEATGHKFALGDEIFAAKQTASEISSAAKKLNTATSSTLSTVTTTKESHE